MAEHSRAEILRTLNVLFRPGDVVELRGFSEVRGREVIESGYYDDLEKLADDAAGLRFSKNVYVTLNVVNPDLLARCANRLKNAPRDGTTSDGDITRRRWMLIDTDPKRPTLISSTDEQHEAALAISVVIGKHLRTLGWPDPVFGDSGNGGHLLYPLDLPNDDAARDLVRDCLLALSARFDETAECGRIEIDKAVFNAARISKLYGTWARKGDNMDRRPHRLAKLLHVPREIIPVPPDLLAALAAEAPQTAARTTNTAPNGGAVGRGGLPGTTYAGKNTPFDMQGFIDRHGIAADGPFPYGQGGTKWQIDCPFDPSHKSPDAILTVSSAGAAGFKCSHDSCSAYHWREFRDRTEPTYREDAERRRAEFEDRRRGSRSRPSPPKVGASVNGEASGTAAGRDKPEALPSIEVNDRDLREISDEAIDALIASNDPPTVFVRGGELARIAWDETNHIHVQTLNEDRATHILARVANFRSTSLKRGCTAVSPPPRVTKDVLNYPTWPGVPPLVGIATSPVVGPDGTLLMSPGYLPNARIFYHEMQKFTLPDTTPTLESIQAARELLTDGLFGDFPFVDQSSRANALALLFLPFVRPYIRGSTPLHLIDAPAKGTGKTLLGKVAASVFMPGGPAMTAAPLSRYGSDDEEWRKKITSIMRNGSPFFFIDNIAGILASPSLDLVLTTTAWEDRMLQKNEMGSFPVRCVFIGTANNVIVGGDTDRRVIWIRLDSGVERPENRAGFRITDIEAYVRENRAQLLGAVLTLLRAWIEAGRPKWGQNPIGSFENWSLTMGGILECVGVEGFLGNREEMMSQLDPERAKWDAFFAQWHEVYGSRRVGVAEVLGIAKEMEIVTSDDASGKAKLGKLLTKERGRVYSGRKLVKADGKGGAKQGIAQYMVTTSEDAQLDFADSTDGGDVVDGGFQAPPISVSDTGVDTYRGGTVKPTSPPSPPSGPNLRRPRDGWPLKTVPGSSEWVIDEEAAARALAAEDAEDAADEPLEDPFADDETLPVTWAQIPLGGQLAWEASAGGLAVGMGATKAIALDDLEQIAKETPGLDDAQIALITAAAQAERRRQVGIDAE